MIDHFVISYSAVDGRDFALKLADVLAAGPPAVPVWVDKRNILPSEDWDEQIDEAIKTCKGMMFIMTPDSVRPNSVCKNEWVRAPKLQEANHSINAGPKSKAAVPAWLPASTSTSADTLRVRLPGYGITLSWMDSPAGQLQALKHRLADAERELPRAEPEQQARIQDGY